MHFNNNLTLWNLERSIANWAVSMDSSFDLFETSSAEDEEEVEEDESILDLEPISEAEQSSFCVEMMKRLNMQRRLWSQPKQVDPEDLHTYQQELWGRNLFISMRYIETF